MWVLYTRAEHGSDECAPVTDRFDTDLHVTVSREPIERLLDPYDRDQLARGTT